MTSCNAPVVSHVMPALDPALPPFEVQDDFLSLSESSCTYLASDTLLGNCSLGFGSRSCTSSFPPQPQMISGPRLSYDGCEEPWFSAWIDDGACAQEPQTCDLPKPVVNNPLLPVDSPACPTTLAVKGSPVCLSSIGSSNGSPLWSSDDEGYDFSVRTTGKSRARSDPYADE